MSSLKFTLLLAYSAGLYIMAVAAIDIIPGLSDTKAHF